MPKEELKLLLNVLQEKRVDLVQKISRIDELIHRYEHELSPSESILATQKNNLSDPILHPALASTTHESMAEQIIAYLRSSERPLKINEIANHLHQAFRPEASIRRIIQRMHRDGLLKLIRINHSNKRSYWALPEWFNHQDLNSLPNNCSSLGVVTTGNETIEIS